MTKLILHVGLGKTGTTAFQDAIRDSFDPLRKAGFLCAGPRLKFAVPEGEELEAQYLAGEPEHLAMALTSLEKAAVSTPGITTAIWSNETIGMAPDLPAVVQTIKRFIDNSSVFETLEVAICLRRQDEWAESAYRQWGLKHKMMDARGIETPEAWLDRSWGALDFLGQYRIWSTLGADRIRLMTYDDMRDAGGSVPFLCAEFGIPVDLLPAEAMGESNVSLGPAQSYMNAIFNGSHEGPVRPIEFAKFLADYDLPELDTANSAFLSNEIRQTILDRCEPDNDTLAQEALGREHLFESKPIGGESLYKNGAEDALIYLCEIVATHREALIEKQAELNDKQHQINRLSGRLTYEAEHLANVAARLRDMEKPGYLFRKIKRRLKAKFGRGS